MVIAAWGCVNGKYLENQRGNPASDPELTAGLAVILTALWALAFTSIYRAPLPGRRQAAGSIKMCRPHCSADPDRFSGQPAAGVTLRHRGARV